MVIFSSLDLMFSMRIGFSKDVHKLIKNRPLILGGVNIPYKKGLDAYSDGDVVLHSLIDAIFGALNKGDIGINFPNTDPKYHNCDSIFLLKETKKIIDICMVNIDYIDIFISCEEPKLETYVGFMKANISEVLDIDINRIGIQCGTNEGLGYIGKKKGIESFATILLKEKSDEQN